MDEWLIERLERTHERTGFHCGKRLCDRLCLNGRGIREHEKWTLTVAGNRCEVVQRVIRHGLHDQPPQYMNTRRGEKRVRGYYTLTSGAISFENLPAKAAKKLPRHPVPVALLARLAVDSAVRGQGLGRLLMLDALRRCLELCAQLGIHAVEVDALDSEAKAFYEKFGFAPLEDQQLHLFLPLATIEQAFRRSEYGHEGST